MFENFQGDSWGSIPPLRMPSLLPHDLCHGRSSSRWLLAVIDFQLNYSRSWKMMLWKVLHSTCNMHSICNMPAPGRQSFCNSLRGFSWWCSLINLVALGTVWFSIGLFTVVPESAASEWPGNLLEKLKLVFTADLPNQKCWWQGWTICVLTSPPGNSDAHSSLGSPGLACREMLLTLILCSLLPPAPVQPSLCSVKKSLCLQDTAGTTGPGAPSPPWIPPHWNHPGFARAGWGQMEFYSLSFFKPDDFSGVQTGCLNSPQKKALRTGDFDSTEAASKAHSKGKGGHQLILPRKWSIKNKSQEKLTVNLISHL